MKVNFASTDTSAQVGFKMFLGITASVTNWDADGTSCSLVFEENPLVDFVELPDTCQGLYYCNILSGVVRGALEMVSSCPSAVQVWCHHPALWGINFIFFPKASYYFNNMDMTSAMCLIPGFILWIRPLNLWDCIDFSELCNVIYLKLI